MDWRLGGFGDGGVDDLRHFGTTQLKSVVGSTMGVGVGEESVDGGPCVQGLVVTMASESVAVTSICKGVHRRSKTLALIWEFRNFTCAIAPSYG